MNVVLLVVDSLRAAALNHTAADAPRTPFLQQLGQRSVHFRRAYATECWTLPAHCSMFTGRLPSQHGAHFQSMAYLQPEPTAAEILATAGFHTEVVTRNFIFDGTIPGITRGFQINTRPLADRYRLSPVALFLALSKPRFRRTVRRTGFFHPLQRDSRQFVRQFAHALLPADGLALDHLLAQMHRLRQRRQPYFLFCNLYDVHAPYPPAEDSLLRPLWPLSGLLEAITLPSVMATLGAHTYLQPGFGLSERSRAMLLSRYHRAIELMDRKLAAFHDAANSAGLLDDTLLIITSDHGEGFGEHGLYLHDASAYETHLHVPLWIQHPHYDPAVVDDVVSTRDLFGLLVAAASNGDRTNTILDAAYRTAHPVATAEHFHYPHATAAPRYRHDLTTVIGQREKLIRRGPAIERYDLQQDPHEQRPEHLSLRAVGDLRGEWPQASLEQLCRAG